MKQGEEINVRDLFSIRGKIALVTGGSRGIGLMIARGYLEAGAKVYISSRKKEVCDATASKLSELGDVFRSRPMCQTQRVVNNWARSCPSASRR
jgi:NAD(P)-dependent dehydrogenase (short-subunit alcohol dehydrogenase family)